MKPIQLIETLVEQGYTRRTGLLEALQQKPPMLDFFTSIEDSATIAAAQNIISSAKVNIADMNDDSPDDEEFSLGLIQVDVDIQGYEFCYQFELIENASIAINAESGSLEVLQSFLTSLNYFTDEQDQEEREDLTFWVADALGRALDVQELFDKYFLNVYILEESEEESDDE